MIFEVILSNNIDTHKLLFKVFDTDIATKWAMEIKKNYKFFENDRFTGFDYGHSKIEYVNMINECIDNINNYKPVILHKAHVNMDDTTINILHKYFEQCRGEY